MPKTTLDDAICSTVPSGLLIGSNGTGTGKHSGGGRLSNHRRVWHAASQCRENSSLPCNISSRNDSITQTQERTRRQVKRRYFLTILLPYFFFFFFESSSPDFLLRPSCAAAIFFDSSPFSAASLFPLHPASSGLPDCTGCQRVRSTLLTGNPRHGPWWLLDRARLGEHPSICRISAACLHRLAKSGSKTNHQTSDTTRKSPSKKNLALGGGETSRSNQTIGCAWTGMPNTQVATLQTRVDLPTNIGRSTVSAAVDGTERATRERRKK